MSDVGLLTLDDPRSIHARVILDGVDVSRDCQAADDRRGWAVCFQRNEHGAFIMTPDHTEIARDVRIGHVEIFIKAPIDRHSREIDLKDGD